MLPIALLVGVFGASQADTAGALGPAILLSVTVSPAATSIAQGATQQFTATGHYSDLSTKDLTNSVTWSSSSTSTATVSNAGLATGVATGVATITANDTAALVSGTAALTVTPSVQTPPTTLPTVPTTLPTVPATLLTVTVTPPVTNIDVGATEQFTATGTYSDLSTRDLTDSVTWSSSTTSTATISNRGLATGVADGLTTITATDPAALVSGTAALTVTPLPTPPATLLAITVSPAIANVAVGAGEQFTATGTYSDLSTQDLTNSVTWASSMTSTATVSNAAGSRGLATGVGEGVTTITATDPASVVSGTAALTVTPITSPVSPAPPVRQLALSPSSGKRKAPIVATGSGFTAGQPVVVTYLSGLKARKRASTVLCRTVAASNGTFTCRGTVPRVRKSGKRGVHTIVASGGGGTGSTNFTLVRR